LPQSLGYPTLVIIDNSPDKQPQTGALSDLLPHYDDDPEDPHLPFELPVSQDKKPDLQLEQPSIQDETSF
jgi:hypothetical protein